MENLSIKIVGLGEGGAKVVSKMMAAGIGKNNSTEFIAVGNDENILLTSTARKNIFLNRDMSIIYKNIFDALDGAKIIFIVAGLAGNAARISIPIIFSFAKTYDAKTVAFVCKPSVLENVTRKINADYTLNYLREADSLFVVPAEKFFVFRINQPKISLNELFEIADDIFCQAVKNFLEIDSSNLKFGEAAFGYGTGKNLLEAIKTAANFPTLEEEEIKSARKVFLRLVSGTPLSLSSIDAAKKFIKAQLQPESEFLLRQEVNPLLGEKIFALIICTRKDENKN